MFKDSPQFLHMLKAEEEGLITISIRVAETERSQFVDALLRCATTNDYGTVPSAWNALRKEICEAAFDNHMVPAASKWARDHLRSMAEEFVAERCRMELEFVSRWMIFSTCCADSRSEAMSDHTPHRTWTWGKPHRFSL
jgi:transcription elongation factor SPT6